MAGAGPDTALLYVAHRLDSHVLAGWTILQRSCAEPGFCPVFVYDNSRGDFTESADLSAGDAWLFTYEDLAQRFPFRTYDPQRPLDQGNATFPILAFFRERPHHPFYWRIEYDVVYEGDWLEFFSDFAGNGADLLTTTLYEPAVRPDWGWWSTLNKPECDPRPLKRLRAFMPIARLSRTACSVLDDAYGEGWSGHDEVAVPSILQSYGLRIEDLGGTGAFTPEDAAEKFYSNAPSSRGLAPGTFVCPPHVPVRDPRPGRLYHPVKHRLDWERETLRAKHP